MHEFPQAILSPCIGVCVLDENGLCEGCLRTGDEIAAWRSLGDATRLWLMDEVLPARALQREGA